MQGKLKTSCLGLLCLLHLGSGYHHASWFYGADQNNKNNDIIIDDDDHVIFWPPTSSSSPPPPPPTSSSSSNPSAAISSSSTSLPNTPDVTGARRQQQHQPLYNDILFDDDDIFMSGSGSGSGDFQIFEGGYDPVGENGTPTQTKAANKTAKKAEANTEEALKIDLSHIDDNLSIGPDNALKNSDSVEDDIVIDHTLDDTEPSNDYDVMSIDDINELFDEPADTSSVTSNHLTNPAAWGPWSQWVDAGKSSKVRVRPCKVGDREVSEVACEGTRLQVKTCDSSTGRCGKPRDVTNLALEGCDKKDYDNVPQDVFVKAPPPPPKVPDAPPPIQLKPSPDECRYSLFDNFRQKFVFTHWNLTSLITKSKVKRWCDKKSGQYIIMSSPLEHCRRYYKDLCKVTQRCRATEAISDAGDFAEGCWRSHVYGERLPIGLSDKDMKTYFICQRFSPRSRTARAFGYKTTYFGTLYDIHLKAPVMSLVKVVSLSDDMWPETDYFIEHGLISYDRNSMWTLGKAKKGMLSLADLDRCYDNQDCDVGKRQVLPQDYGNPFPDEDQYAPTHLVWPEFMSSDPGARLSTFTLTNTAPLLKSLFKEWREAVKKVGQFALEKCRLPYHLDLDIHHPGQFSTHRSHKSALYIASGILPNVDPVVTTGHGVHVPFLFWMSGCCVHNFAGAPNNTHHSNPNDETNNSKDVYMSWEENDTSDAIRTQVSSFSVYIRNTPESHVIWAPVLQLEMLLQNVFKVEDNLDDITLFPGHGSVCSDLKNDASLWFQQ